MRLFGRENERAIERKIERNEGQIARGSLNRPLVNLNRWMCREVSRHLSRKVSRNWSSTYTGIAEVSWNKPSDARTEARSIHQLLRSYRGSRNFLDWSTSYQGSVEIAIRKSLEAQQIAKCQGGVELAFKNGFLTREKYRHECNQARNSTKDPISNLNSQNHLLTTILST